MAEEERQVRQKISSRDESDLPHARLSLQRDIDHTLLANTRKHRKPQPISRYCIVFPGTERQLAKVKHSQLPHNSSRQFFKTAKANSLHCRGAIAAKSLDIGSTSKPIVRNAPLPCCVNRWIGMRRS